jgi:hypothetical protein
MLPYIGFPVTQVLKGTRKLTSLVKQRRDIAESAIKADLFGDLSYAMGGYSSRQEGGVTMTLQAQVKAQRIVLINNHVHYQVEVQDAV